MKLISPENSSRGKDEIDINLNQNHIIGVSPAKEEIIIMKTKKILYQ